MLTIEKNITDTGTTRFTASGELHVCAHRVTYYYDVESNDPLDPETNEALEEEAERRARECIAYDYVSWELHCLYVFSDGSDKLFSGWGEIEKS